MLAYVDAPTDLLTGIFPWVETEQSALESCQKPFGRKADDPRLQHFLNLLIFFCTVILQDVAVLYSWYPNCLLFDYYPFTTPLFHSFAVSAGPLLDAAEVEGRHYLNNLPEQFSASLWGIVTTFALENQKLSQALLKQTSMLKAMQGHLGDVMRSEPPRKHHKGMACVSLPYTSYKLPRCPVVYISNSLASSKSMLDNVLSLSHVLMPNSVPNLPSPATFPIISASDIVPLSVPKMTMSTSGELYSTSIFQLSDILQTRGLQLKGIDILEAEFGATQLWHHSFWWTMSNASDVPDEWQPSYKFYQPGGNKQATLEDIWKEWSIGINGCISVECLGQYWDTWWHRSDKAKKTMASWWKHIIDLMTELISKRGWDEKRALRFLHENYVPVKFSMVCGFIDHLQKQEKGVDGLTNSEQIVENAM